MEKTKYHEDAFFTVSLDGIKLTEQQVRNIDRGIKEVVAREIAQIDHQGDLVINQKLNLHPRFSGIRWPIWFGIWIETLDVYRKRFLEQVK